MVLIGQNNSGKSNVLDAVKKAVTGDFDEDDRRDGSDAAPEAEIAIIHGTDRMTAPKRSEALLKKASRFIGTISKNQDVMRREQEFADACSALQEKYGFPLRPGVIEYRQENVRNRDLSCSPR